jgi:hypothetical protein
VNTTTHTYPVPGRLGGSAVEVKINTYTDGDAKWFNEEVTVTPGVTYTYSDWYKADDISDIIGRYTFANGSVQYIGVAKELVPTSEWKQASGSFLVPSGVVSVTFMHLISSIATLTIDDTSLVSVGSTTPVNLIDNPSLENIDGSGNPLSWFTDIWDQNNAVFTYPVMGVLGGKAAKVSITNYVSGDAKWYFAPKFITGGGKYVLSDHYLSDVTTHIVVRYTLSGGTFSYNEIAALAPAATWTKWSGTITAPLNATAVSIFHVLRSVGSLSVDEYALSPA